MNSSQWRELPFTRAFEDKTAQAHKVDQDQFLSSGKHPIIDQGQSFIAGYSDNPALVWKGKLPVVIFGDHTRAIKYVDFPFILGADGTKVLMPNSALWPRFAYYQLVNFNVPSAGYSRHFKFLKELSFVFPPLPEQQRIAGILARADRLRRLRRYALELSDGYLQAVFVEMFGDPVRNPKGWKEGQLARLCAKTIDCPHATPIYSSDPTPYACVRSSDIQNGYLDWSTTKYVSEPAYKSRVERLVPAPGDVVYCREGARFGNAAIIPRDTKVCLGQRMMLFRASPGTAMAEFIWTTLESEAIYVQAARLAGGSASPHVNVQDIKAFTVMIPPFELQCQFAHVVQKHNHLRAQQREALRQAEQLFGALLHRAFRGEL